MYALFCRNQKSSFLRQEFLGSHIFPCRMVAGVFVWKHPPLCTLGKFFAFKMFFHPTKKPCLLDLSREDLKQKLRRVARAQPFDPRLAGDQVDLWSLWRSNLKKDSLKKNIKNVAQTLGKSIFFRGCSKSVISICRYTLYV